LRSQSPAYARQGHCQGLFRPCSRTLVVTPLFTRALDSDGPQGRAHTEETPAPVPPRTLHSRQTHAALTQESRLPLLAATDLRPALSQWCSRVSLRTAQEPVPPLVYGEVYPEEPNPTRVRPPFPLAAYDLKLAPRRWCLRVDSRTCPGLMPPFGYGEVYSLAIVSRYLPRRPVT